MVPCACDVVEMMYFCLVRLIFNDDYNNITHKLIHHCHTEDHS